MFNLVMRWFDWADGNATMPIGRMFEYTEEHLAEHFRQDQHPNLDSLIRLPCLFMTEGTDDEICHVGSITRARLANREVHFEYVLDREVPPLTNATIFAARRQLDMPHDFEFSRNHWAVKDVDLYRFLLRSARPKRQKPTVFQIPDHENIEPKLASAMMPFDTAFAPVYESIRHAAEAGGLRCRRADDIWENPAIIQDVVSLIDRSRVVICDCTGRNPNVFYEAGIAHTLGREVILITQNDQDIPFDLRHLRYIRYFNNGEGRNDLAAAITGRIQTIVGH
jgi:hypothetical protein